ncbi:Ubiquitin carboxyl-terminal hydrolase 16 [Dissophora globulifera]|uniref:ubiquitinyl hydrolase 1 n=1 Tax=Dissophora globulifera TaxID=979702 RepID=A0A9P6RF88_9FUNG|nr:Ubiquitin carboxyl-terminal hydrolase 16 [Dissophora globulifera]
MAPNKKKSGKAKAKAKSGGDKRVHQNDHEADDDAILDAIIAASTKTAANAGIATLEESVLSGAIEASLQSFDNIALQPTADNNNDSYNDIDNDILVNAIHEAQHGEGTENCQHVKDAIKPSLFRRLIAAQKDWDHCHSCLERHAHTKKMMQGLDPRFAAMALADLNADASEPLPADALWMCLSCGEINCGRAFKKHAVDHYNKPGSKHPLAFNLASMECWCYMCDDRLVISKNKNAVALECHSLLYRTLQARQAKLRGKFSASVALAKKSKGAVATTTSTIAKVKIHTPGLQNLGNTCFFNSVMQVLTETRSLRTVLGDKSQSDFSTSLSAITDTGLGPLTTTFKDFLFTMWKQQSGIVTPRDLFTQIAKKWKVFRGFKEQDSQELMRHLFDGIRLEEVDLIKKRVAEKNESSAAPVANTRSKYAPFIDSCFSGKLVSVIVCHSCKMCSYSYEDYFDLSLPVKGTPPVVSGGSFKDLLIARSRAAGFELSLTPDADDKYPISAKDQGSEAHLKHVEKLLKNVSAASASSDVLSIERSLSQFTSVDCLEGENKFACENCYKLNKGYGRISETRDESLSLPTADTNVVPKDKEREQTDMEGAVDDTKVELEEEEEDSGSKENTSEPDTDGDRLTAAAAPKGQKTVAASSTDTTLSTTGEPQHILRKAYKRYLISSLPPTLVLHLKRFEQSTSRFGLMRKIEDQVDIPVEIDMSAYCIPQSDLVDEGDEGQDAEEKRKALAEARGAEESDKVSKKYRLYGATVHQGSLATGHYTNYVLSSKVEVPEPSTTTKTMEGGKDKVSSPATASSAALGVDMPDVPLSVLLAQQGQKKAKAGGKNKAGQGKKSGAVAPPAAAATPAAEAVVESDTKPSAASKEEAADTRQWIHCSDTNVRPATLQEVLSSRPYLVYYERC